MIWIAVDAMGGDDAPGPVIDLHAEGGRGVRVAAAEAERVREHDETPLGAELRALGVVDAPVEVDAGRRGLDPGRRRLGPSPAAGRRRAGHRHEEALQSTAVVGTVDGRGGRHPVRIGLDSRG